MQSTDQFEFQSPSPQALVERAVAELRFGRPVLLEEGNRRMATLSLDCTAPETYENFACACGTNHSLLITRPRAERLGLQPKTDISVPLNSVSFEAASRLAFGLGEQYAGPWSAADEMMHLSSLLAETALLLPAMICCDVSDRSSRFAGCLSLALSDLRAGCDAQQSFTQVARTSVPLRDLGPADFVVFRGGLAQRDQIAIVVGEPDLSAPVPVRIHSSCITGDLFGSLKCDCGDQLVNGLQQIKDAGGGILLYLDQEGRGTGIGAKMRAYGFQHKGLDTIDADAELGLREDHRRYDAAVAMLKSLGVSKVQLHTNNPTKIAALETAGLAVAGRQPIPARITAENIGYLRTKSSRAKHLLDHLPLEAAE